MKHPISLLLLLSMLIPMSCFINQNELTLDKMTGKWELISGICIFPDGSIDDDYYATSYHYIHVTIIKESHNAGIWREDRITKSDSILYLSHDKEFEISRSGTRLKFADIGSGWFGSSTLSYEVSFEDQNLRLSYDFGDKRGELIRTLTPIK